MLTPSGTAAFGSAASARSIALSMTGAAPSTSGVTRTRVVPSSSSRGVSNACCTAAVAASGASPPTCTPPIVTPTGIATGSSAAGSADATAPVTSEAGHDHEQERKTLHACEHRKDPRIVRDDSVGSIANEPLGQPRVVDRPDVDRRAELVRPRDRRLGRDGVVERRRARLGRGRGIPAGGGARRRRSSPGRVADDRRERASLGDPEAVAGQRVGRAAGRARAPRSLRSERASKVLTHERSSTLVAAAPPRRRRLDAATLEIELEPDPREGRSAQKASASSRVGNPGATCLRSARCRRRTRPRAAPWLTSRRSSGMREHERPVDEVEHVELEHVAPELDRELERRERVLGRERGRTAMADARELARRPAKLDQVRFTTTTAQSSASSPRANARQSSSTHCASSLAGRSRRSPSSRSRRASPVQLPVTTSLDHAVGIEDDRAAVLERRPHLLVAPDSTRSRGRALVPRGR